MTAGRFLRAAILAALCALFFATHVYTSYAGIRARIVRTPIQATSDEVRATAEPATLRELKAPFAVIARLRNDSADAHEFAIVIDGVTVCAPVVAPRTVRRVDCVWNRAWDSRQSHPVAVQSRADRWGLEYLELATHHGSSAGGLTFVLLPSVSHLYTSPSVLAVLALWLGLTLVWSLPRPALPRWVVWLHRAIAGVFAVWCVAFVVMPYVSTYTVVVDDGSFLSWVLFISAPMLYGALRAPIRTLAASKTRAASTTRLGLVALAVFACFTAVHQHLLRDAFHGNYSGFIRIGRIFIDHNPILQSRDDVRRTLWIVEGGYDAQFMYYAAFDPLLRTFHSTPERYIDMTDGTPYRYGRIGLTWLAVLVSGDRWPWFPTAMCWLVLAGAFGAALALAALARASGASAAWGLLILAVPGFWESIQVSLPEPIAAAALLGGYWCATRRHWILGALLFALSLLTRETGVVLVVATAVGVFLSGRRRDAVLGLALALAPFVIWRAYLASVLFPVWRWDAVFVNPHNVAIPFGGIGHLWAALSRGELHDGSLEGAIGFPLVLTVGFLLSLALAVRRPTALNVALAVYALMAISLDFDHVWIAVGNASRVSFELFAVLAIATIHVQAMSRAWRAAAAAFWTLSVWYILFDAYSRAPIRDTLLPFLP